MSFCNGCSFFPSFSIALRLVVYSVSKPRFSLYIDLAVARYHLPPIYDLDVCVGLQSSGRCDGLGVVPGDPGLVA